MKTLAEIREYRDMKHTKGEWLVHSWGKAYQIVEAEPHTVEKPGITMTGQRILAREISKANAYLMAAAPDMYEALQLWTQHNQGTRGHYCSECATAIDKALAKALSPDR